MTAKPVPEHISDELLLEALKPFAALGQYLIDHGFITKPDDAGLWGFDNHTLTYGDFRAAAAALTELQHRREAEAGILAQDVIDLVIAARMVAYEDQSPEAIRALDKAVEAFAERVGWENDPDDEALSALGEHP
jgi:hypothetical protein